MSSLLKFISTWRIALPSVAVGTLAVLVAAYGTLLLPKKLPARYSAALELKLKRLANLKATENFGAIRDQAAELDVIYQRLVLMDGYSNSSYWHWAVFQCEFANYLTSILSDSEATLSTELRESFVDQQARFREQSKATLTQLSVGESEFRDKAALQLASIVYDEGMAEFGVVNATTVAAQLAELVVGDSPQLSESERSEAAELLNRTTLEAAWNGNGKVLSLDVSSLNKEFAGIEASGRWLSQEQADLFESLFQAYGLDYPSGADNLDKEGRNSNEDLRSNEIESASPTKSWREEFAKLQRLSLNAQWEELNLRLAKGGTDNDSALAAGTARTLCRLLCSQWAGEQTDEAKLEKAVELVARLAPHLPEFAEVIWASAAKQLDEDDTIYKTISEEHSLASVNDQTISAIATGSSAMLKHSVFAISNALEGRENVAKSHLQLIKRGGGNLSLVARATLRHIQVLNAQQSGDDLDGKVDIPSEDGNLSLQRLEALLNSATVYEKESGLNWFTLASLELKLGKTAEAKVAAEKAVELLGKLPAAEQLLQAIEEAEKAEQVQN